MNSKKRSLIIRITAIVCAVLILGSVGLSVIMNIFYA